MRTVVVTGVQGGIGVALSASFRSAGYRVVGTDRMTGPAQCDAFVAIDLAEAISEPSWFDERIAPLRSAIAQEELVGLVNNAAVQILGATEEVSFDDWHYSLNVNLTAPFFLTKALLPQLERANGTVINIGSVHAHATKPRFVTYATTKAALLGLTRAMAVDLGPKARVLAVNPAAVDTPMLRAGFEGRPETFHKLSGVHPLARIGTPEEISAVVVFLVSQAASFMTGTTIDLDGGILSRLHDVE